jgi:hypothetical protein
MLLLLLLLLLLLVGEASQGLRSIHLGVLLVCWTWLLSRRD